MRNHLDRQRESELVRLARTGDGDAFETLVNLYDESLFRMVLNITRNREDAEDVLQEALVKAYTNLARFQGDSRFYTWLVRIAINEALMKLRQRRPQRTVSLEEMVENHGSVAMPWESSDNEHPERRYATLELNETLSHALRRLDPAFREVFWLRVVQQFSTRETAAILRVSVTAVKTRLRRARIELRHRLTRSMCRTDAWQANKGMAAAPAVPGRPEDLGFLPLEK